MILKATALVSLLGLEDVVKATQLAGKKHLGAFLFCRGLWTYLPGIYHRFQWCAGSYLSVAIPWA
ncbi:histidine transporter permease [Salmonella enterica subsp. enterica]|uniref:Histidine transporter permease n=1 Tax=Salmonella enterica I TaxID=59201 RepID=A0A447TZ25_SALET|nr:histidine transporter permease [Salmonella enterica subsp. enterica]